MSATENNTNREMSEEAFEAAIDTILATLPEGVVGCYGEDELDIWFTPGTDPEFMARTLVDIDTERRKHLTEEWLEVTEPIGTVGGEPLYVSRSAPTPDALVAIDDDGNLFDIDTREVLYRFG